MVVVAPAPASATEADEATPDRDRVAAAVVYRVDPENGEVRATARVTVRNVDPAATSEIEAVSLVLPAVAPETVAASRSGVAVAVAAGPADDDFAVFTFSLGRAIGPGEVAELSVTFVIRSSVGLRVPSATRIDPAYVSFPARGIGDPGSGSVAIEWPAFFEARWIGVDAERVDEGFVATLATDGVGRDFAAVFEMRNDDRLERTGLAIPGTDAGVELATWEGDVFWRFGIGADLVVLIPTLVDLVGEPWSLTGTLVVRETNADVVHGYGGSFVRTPDGGGEIEMGTVLDRRILAHELAHAWFDRRLDPWLAEGLAEEYARQATGRTGFTPVARDDPAAVALELWEPRAGADETDRHAYAAAAGLFSTLAAEIGDEALRDAASGLLGDGSPYGDDLPIVDGLRDWQRLLDHAEAAGSEMIEPLLVDWVLATPPRDVLAARTDARDGLAAFEARSGEWGVPSAIRLALARWDFATAEEAMTAASALLDERDRLAAASAAAGVAVPDDAEALFATDPRGAAEALLAQADGLAAVEAAQAAVAASRSWVADIGSWGTDVDADLAAVVAHYEAGEHDAAVQRADALRRDIDGAESLGARRIAAAVAGVAVLALAGLLIGVRRVRRTAAAG